jgi:N-hydroxyarylamine O-acetyltransferase
MDIELYLKRINYHGGTEPTIRTLKQLQWSHLFAVPFENLDIHLGIPIRLDLNRIYDKIVLHRRGGFCYELNGLFCALLRQLGYSVNMLAARVLDTQGNMGIKFAHLILMVELEKRWLVDVGFGDSFLYPLQLDSQEQQSDGRANYRISQENERYCLWSREIQADEWQAQHVFTLSSYNLADFEEACEYQQTSPESHFTQKTVCTLPTTNGRITLSNNRLIIRDRDGKSEVTLNDKAEIARTLRENFGMIL